MPKRSSPSFIPKYHRHRASGQARVCLNGRQFYLGPYASRTSRIRGATASHQPDSPRPRIEREVDWGAVRRLHR